MVAGINVEVLGGQHVIAQLKEQELRIERGVRVGTEAALVLLRDAERRGAPHRTGRLASAINKYGPIGAGGDYSGTVGQGPRGRTPFYAKIVEHGVPHSWLEPLTGLGSRSRPRKPMTTPYGIFSYVVHPPTRSNPYFERTFTNPAVQETMVGAWVAGIRAS